MPGDRHVWIDACVRAPADAGDAQALECAARLRLQTVTIYMPAQRQASAHSVHAWRSQLANCTAVMHCSAASTSA
ncbi:hypothetical protein IM53_020290 [Xanthomonas phaseoli pv. dieffenbachiae]|uniref:Uncharacterized protein n=1 Tax=Xanthomonas phaseoli pv. dieffenbachiae TaxID=92828 RepID=A0A1V9GV68_9XANT|nr:hypothetical protein IM53_020290 [Xanthomonas phaseoli pv. dieffenbachiae]